MYGAAQRVVVAGVAPVRRRAAVAAVGRRSASLGGVGFDDAARVTVCARDGLDAGERILALQLAGEALQLSVVGA